MQPTHARWEQIDDHKTETKWNLLRNYPGNEEDQTPSIFPPVKPIYSRNFMIVDTIYESGSASNLGIPGPDGDANDLGFTGLSTIPDHIKAELPLDCLRALEEVLNKEQKWKSKWGDESHFGHRRPPAIDKGVV